MDVEVRLLQIMDDEFETIVDDGTAYDVAEQVLLLWRECSRGQSKEVDRLRRRWEAGQGKKVSSQFQAGAEVNQDTDGDTDDDGEDGEDGEEHGDVDMDDVPALVPVRKEKPPPEVDEDYFTTVARKKFK